MYPSEGHSGVDDKRDAVFPRVNEIVHPFIPFVLFAPSLSVAVMVITWPWSGPSPVLKDQFQLPSSLSTTAPTDAVRVTTSATGSKNVPATGETHPL